MSNRTSKNVGFSQFPWGRGLTAVILLFVCQVQLFAEYTARYEPAPGESHVQIDGTSNLHDWSIKGTVIDGYIDVNETCRFNLAMEKLPDLGKVKVSLKTHVEIPVKSLKSGHSGMDDNTYKALKSRQYPKIIYDMEKVSVKTMPKPPNLIAEFDTVGRLSIAGVTRTLNMPVTVKALEDQQFEISGTTTIKMTDFGVTPPTAIFGLLRTGDQITIHFIWTLDRKTPLPHLPQYSAPLDYRQAVAGMLLAYLQAEDALASNQLSKAKEALAGVEKATQKLSQIQDAKLPEDGKKAWQKDVERLSDSARDAAKAETLDSVRLAFRKLSQDAIALVSDFGYVPLGTDKPLFSYRCSRNDEQAKEKVWLQNTAAADSPYEPTVRGHLSCGSQTAIYCPQRYSSESSENKSEEKTPNSASPLKPSDSGS
jgi:hypothetical protein